MKPLKTALLQLYSMIRQRACALGILVKSVSKIMYLADQITFTCRANGLMSFDNNPVTFGCKMTTLSLQLSL